jgi:hypothetical protein
MVGYLARGTHVFVPVPPPEGWGDVIRRMGSEYLDVRTFRLGHPFTPSYAVITLDKIQLRWEPLGTIIGPCTIRGHALIGRYQTGWPKIASLTPEDWQKLIQKGRA